ncbi:MAG TPA: DNA/RNA non-specific endonuclease [Solirubrobacterales bacterium]|nr:DNA/RNA non-specific endonuclease [Solirubrobacterales bacterium]
MSVLAETGQSQLAEEQQRGAAARVAARETEREQNLVTLGRQGGLGFADEPGRVAARLDRLSRYWARAPLPAQREDAPHGSPDEIVETAIGRGMAWGARPGGEPLEAAGEVLEKIIGTVDFVGVNYLERGLTAAHAVGRVDIGPAGGRPGGYGTGSMVAPHVFLTNHHVLPDAETAAASAVEFDFEDGPDGQPRQSRRFAFAPDALFVADEDLDFALVAVEPDATAVDAYGYNPLIEAEGKVIVGECVSIVQHPSGQRKQVALRENKVVDRVEQMLHYRTDTEPGSSGSPVFNDQWEFVALHHASVPSDAEPGKVINEGIRVSQIIGRLRQLAGPQPSPLLVLVLEPTLVRPAPVATPSLDGAGPPDGRPPGGEALEKVEIEPDYSNRKGYDAAFLGSGNRSVPLPKLSDELLADAPTWGDGAGADGAGKDGAHVLPYHHFSLVMSKARKLARFTAVNIDGATEQRIKRDPDRWSFDPRIPTDYQMGEAIYVDNELDRGHLVRRLDPAWGEIAKAANDDTFHFTNCSPQHGDFNRNATLWAGLEDYILDHADNEQFKVSVFSGPVLEDDDPEYRGVQLPRQFWKVVAMAKSPGLLSATAYLLSQESLIEGLEVAPEEFTFGAYSTFQVQVGEVERLTGLDFGGLRDFDPLGAQEATRTAPRKVVHEEYLIL